MSNICAIETKSTTALEMKEYRYNNSCDPLMRISVVQGCNEYSLTNFDHCSKVITNLYNF